jgi:hypothetical protein
LHQPIKVNAMNKNQKQTAELELIVKDKILNRLGTPYNLHEITARNVFSNKWRVNVWVKTLNDGNTVAKSYSIAHSFFCELTEGGTLRTSPKIKKRLYRRTDDQSNT